jgi:hypothetical protein
MEIWGDADACPGGIKELLYRTAKRLKIKLTLVANQPMSTPRSEFIDSLCSAPRGLAVLPRSFGRACARQLAMIVVSSLGMFLDSASHIWIGDGRSAIR